MGVDGLHTEAGEEGGVVLGHEKAQGEAGGRLPEGEEGEGVKAGNPHPLPPPEEGGEAARRLLPEAGEGLELHVEDGLGKGLLEGEDLFQAGQVGLLGLEVGVVHLEDGA